MSRVRLIAGPGNPGASYADTRHNAGARFVARLADQYGVVPGVEKKLSGLCARVHTAGETVTLLIPLTYMNCSGTAVAAALRFYRIDPEEMLVVHDELDFEPGLIRFKKGGGHGGHNGLRDIIRHCGSREFMRLRIGIGHPGPGRDVSSYVLKPPSVSDSARIDAAMDHALSLAGAMVTGPDQHCIQQLHSFKG